MCWRRLFVVLGLCAVLPAQGDALLLQPFGPVGETPAAPWHLAGLPHQHKPFTHFSVVDVDGHHALRVEAESSYGNLVHPLHLSADALKLSWQWRVERFAADADLRTKVGDDTTIKVCVAFDLPIDHVPYLDRQLLRLARAASDEPLPAATICYVWDPHQLPGTALHSPYTHRLRYLVLDGAEHPPLAWVAQRRDVAADFELLFGEESAQVPPIIGVAVGADTDNTHGHSLAHVADLVLAP